MLLGKSGGQLKLSPMLSGTIWHRNLHMNLSKPGEIVEDRGTWRAAGRGVAKQWA